MTVIEYYNLIATHIKVLSRVRPRMISAKKLLDPVRNIVAMWSGVQDVLLGIQVVPDTIKNIGIIVADLASDTGRDDQPRLKLLRKLRNLRSLIYPFTLNPAVRTRGSGLILFFEKQTFQLYNYLTDQITTAKNRVLILDSYIDKATLSMLYGLPKTALIKILTRRPNDALLIAWGKFRQEFHYGELRRHRDVHDRLIIVDDHAFMSGPSLKDAGTKPTLLAHFDSFDSKKAVNFFERFWKIGKSC